MFRGNQSQLTRHLRTCKEKPSSPEKSFECGKCFYSCTSKSGLTRHTKSLHPTPTRHTAKVYACGHCSYTSERKFDLNRHEKVHSGKKRGAVDELDGPAYKMLARVVTREEMEDFCIDTTVLFS